MERWVRRAVRELQAYVPGEQPGHADILKLNTNENPYPPSPRVTEALRGVAPERLARYPDPACADLRATIAGLHGTGVEQVFVGNGSDEVLALALRAFVEEGAPVGYFEPSYSVYPVLVDIHGARRRPTPLPADFGWTEPDVEGCGLFFLTNPNAPTSLLFPRDQVEAFCRSFDGVVVIDEAYVDFSRAHCMELAFQCPNVLVTRSLSKAYSLASIRLGYAVGAPPLVEALMKVKDSYNVNGLTQAVARAALEDQAHLRGNVERIRQTRAAVSAELRQRGFEVAESETNFLWVRPDGPRAETLYAGLREQGVLIRHFPGPATGNFLRITIGSDRQMERFLGALDKVR